MDKTTDDGPESKEEVIEEPEKQICQVSKNIIRPLIFAKSVMFKLFKYSS